MKIFLLCFLLLGTSGFVSAQGGLEILTNEDVVLMTKAGLNKTLIIRKVKESKNNFDVTAQSLVALKNAGVEDEVIAAIMDGNSLVNKKTTGDVKTQTAPEPDNQSSKPNVKPVISATEALRAAKTIAIVKSSLHPSRQALEKELLRRKEWQALNLNIVRYKESADLYIEIGFVPLSLITHRYVFRVYDNRSGTVIVAGQTTSWGSLAGNMAKEIIKKLTKAFDAGK